jgi:hypothetical protein
MGYINMPSSKTFISYVRFEASTAVSMKNAVFWYFKSCGCCNKRRLIGAHHLHHQGDKNRRAMNYIFLGSVLRLLFTVMVLPRTPILITLMR